MPATLDQVKGFLSERGTRYFQHPDRDTLVVHIVINGEMTAIFIALHEGGQWVKLQIPWFVRAESASPTFLRELLALNSQHKLGTFSVDPKDNEVSLEVGFPVEDGELTLRQFTRMISALCGITREFRSHLRKLADSRDPEEDQSVQAARPDMAKVNEVFERLLRGDERSQDASSADENSCLGGVDQFVQEHCNRNPEAKVEGKKLYGAYHQFCEHKRMKARGKRDFNKALRELGISSAPGSYNGIWAGLELVEIAEG